MKKPEILFRSSFQTSKELEVARQFFAVRTQRSQCGPAIIIGRYSVLPFYDELSEDICWNGGILINSPAQHRYISEFSYYEDIKDFTPESWREHEMPAVDYNGPFVVKGATNSRKWNWATEMFAQDKHASLLVGSKLACDSLIGSQGLIYRKYIPLETFEVGLNGLPFTNEWRAFYLGDNLLSLNYYWSCADDLTKPYLEPAAIALLKKVSIILSERVNFFAIDIARTQDGEWIVIEVNDGQMAGVAEEGAKSLYSNMKNVLDRGFKLK